MGGTGGEGVRERGIEYHPLPSQQRFHESRARFKGFSGPIESGKSQALCQEALKLAYLNPGRTGLLGAPTFPMLRDATQAALIEILERNRIPHEWNRGESYLRLSETRSRILFRAVEEFERLRGTNLAWFGLDELTYAPREAWLRLEGRLRDPKAARLCGFAVWTPKGFDWMHERFVGSPVEGYETVQARPFENQFLLDRVPDYYQRLKHSYDGRFYEQEVLGEYLELTAGRVYFAFSRAGNVAEVGIAQGSPLLWALDFNVDPMSSVVAQMDGEEVRVLDEIVLNRASTYDACTEFGSRFAEHAGGLVIYQATQSHTLYAGLRYIGTGGTVSVGVDGGAAVSVNLAIPAEDVLFRYSLGTFFAGSDTVAATHAGAAGTEVHFDFLELASPSADLPVIASQTVVTLATDWDTLHCISLPPERTAWMLTALNFVGRANHYIGALRFYELVRAGHVYASVTVTFSGTPVPNAYVTITLGQIGQPSSSDTVLQKQIHVGDTADAIALAFAQELNRGYTGVWASVAGNVLTITARTMGLAGDANTVAATTTSGGFTATASGRASREARTGTGGRTCRQARRSIARCEIGLRHILWHW